MKRPTVKEDPRVVTRDRIITERYKAEDIIKLKLGSYRKIGECVYKGVIFWELIRIEDGS